MHITVCYYCKWGLFSPHAFYHLSLIIHVLTNGFAPSWFHPDSVRNRNMYWYYFLLTQLLKERFEFARSFNLTAENISLHTVCFIMQYLVCDWTKFARCCTCTNTSCGFCIFYFHKVLLTLSIDTKPVVCDNDDVVCRCI